MQPQLLQAGKHGCPAVVAAARCRLQMHVKALQVEPGQLLQVVAGQVELCLRETEPVGRLAVARDYIATGVT